MNESKIVQILEGAKELHKPLTDNRGRKVKQFLLLSHQNFLLHVTSVSISVSKKKAMLVVATFHVSDMGQCQESSAELHGEWQMRSDDTRSHIASCTPCIIPRIPCVMVMFSCAFMHIHSVSDFQQEHDGCKAKESNEQRDDMSEVVRTP